MHRTTIVQNKIINIICSSFFCPANIYRPTLMKVLLGRPNTKPIQLVNFYLRWKKNILFRIVCTITVWCRIFNLDFHLFLKIFKKNIQNDVKFFNYIYNNYSLNVFFENRPS